MTKCNYCSEEPVAYLKYFNGKLCKNHFCELTERRIQKNITKHELLQKNDKIAVAVSGGKDSTVLLHYLSEFRKRMPLSLFGIVVDEGIKNYRDKSIKVAKKNFKELKVPYKIVSFKKEFRKTLDEIVKTGEKIPCSYCGVFRRRLLNNAAKSIKADRIATGHNLDDEIQSVVMNYMRGDFARMQRIGPKTTAGKGFVQRIKPLREIPEKEIGLYALLQNYNFYPAECPYTSDSFRGDVREHLNRLEAVHPGIKFSILKGADKLNKLLERQKFFAALHECKKCGEFSTEMVCKVCKLVFELKK